ncbi:MAG: DUF4928 family protein [Atopobiaceae bacterium]|nr:DUF4928 family protein [Atopobiaceae bacterium]
MRTIDIELDDFREHQEDKVMGKGSLSAALILTRSFSTDALPINPEDYKTKKEGQVKGLGGGRVKAILRDHGITRILAKEGGRTNRGNMSLMYAYADFINGIYERDGHIDFEAVEDYWVGRVRVYFNSMPFKLSSDSARSMDSAIDDLIGQARKRERESPGATYAGTVLQHLVAAKLCLLVEDVEVNGASSADEQTGRAGDFMVGDVAIHCTTMAGQLLMEKCKSNIRAGVRPVIITIRERVGTARALAEDNGIADRIEVWDIQQFLSTNVYEHGLFNAEARRDTMASIVAEYNGIITEHETDPSLMIEFE